MNGFSVLLFDRVTGRIVVPFINGELGDDLGERGVRGLSPSELIAPGVSGVVLLLPGFSKVEPKFRLGTTECLVGILDISGCSAGGRTGG